MADTSQVETNPVETTAAEIITAEIIAAETTAAEIIAAETTAKEVVENAIEQAVEQAVEQVVGDSQITAIVTEVAKQTTNELFNKCLSELTQKGTEMGLSLEPNSIMTYVKLCMEIVEKTDVKGPQQKTLVIQLVTQLVKDAPISDDKETLCLDMLKSGVVGDTIDIIVMASKGQVDLNMVTKTAMGCLPKLIACFKKK
jgi:hypothetical protein